MTLEEEISKNIKLEALDEHRMRGICPVCRGNTFTVNTTEQYWGCAVCEMGGKAERFRALMNQTMGI